MLEDLGDRVFGAEVARGADQAALWGAAVDVLLALADRARRRERCRSRAMRPIAFPT